MAKKTMSVKEVANELGTSEENVRTMIHCGIIPKAFAFKKKNSRRYTYLILRQEFLSWSSDTTDNKFK